MLAIVIRSCGYSDIGVVDQANMATNNVPRIAVLVEFNYEDLEVIHNLRNANLQIFNAPFCFRYGILF